MKKYIFSFLLFFLLFILSGVSYAQTETGVEKNTENFFCECELARGLSLGSGLAKHGKKDQADYVACQQYWMIEAALELSRESEEVRTKLSQGYLTSWDGKYGTKTQKLVTVLQDHFFRGNLLDSIQAFRAHSCGVPPPPIVELPTKTVSVSGGGAVPSNSKKSNISIVGVETGENGRLVYLAIIQGQSGFVKFPFLTRTESAKIPGNNKEKYYALNTTQGLAFYHFDPRDNARPLKVLVTVPLDQMPVLLSPGPSSQPSGPVEKQDDQEGGVDGEGNSETKNQILGTGKIGFTKPKFPSTLSLRLGPGLRSGSGPVRSEDQLSFSEMTPSQIRELASQEEGGLGSRIYRIAFREAFQDSVRAFEYGEERDSLVAEFGDSAVSRAEELVQADSLRRAGDPNSFLIEGGLGLNVLPWMLGSEGQFGPRGSLLSPTVSGTWMHCIPKTRAELVIGGIFSSAMMGFVPHWGNRSFSVSAGIRAPLGSKLPSYIRNKNGSSPIFGFDLVVGTNRITDQFSELYLVTDSEKGRAPKNETSLFIGTVVSFSEETDLSVWHAKISGFTGFTGFALMDLAYARKSKLDNSLAVGGRCQAFYRAVQSEAGEYQEGYYLGPEFIFKFPLFEKSAGLRMSYLIEPNRAYQGTRVALGSPKEDYPEASQAGNGIASLALSINL